MEQSIEQSVEHIIRERKTAKLLQNPTQCSDLSSKMAAEVRGALQAMIEVAGWAPFHKVANEQAHRQDGMASPVPWRFYVLEKPDCCRVMRFIEQQAEANPESKWTKAAGSKVPKLLAGCSALVLVTWLPDPPKEGDTPELSLNNMEHIAAASAAIQNLLLVAQGRGWHNYWASGGILREDESFAYLNIPQNQILLGALYLAHPDQPHAENIPGGLRNQRGEVSEWAKWVRLSEED